jgi:hypothetical protein
LNGFAAFCDLQALFCPSFFGYNQHLEQDLTALRKMTIKFEGKDKFVFLLALYGNRPAF